MTGPARHAIATLADGHATLWIELPAGYQALSSGMLGGGIGDARWIVNAQVPIGYARTDPEAHLGEIAAELGLAGRGAGLLTAASVREVSVAECDGALALVTVGLSLPLRAGDPIVSPRTPGTINVICIAPVRLADGALVNAACAVTEAKVRALSELGVPGTGTATDAVCIACPGDGEAEPFGGPASEWGSRLATAAYRATCDGAAALIARKGRPWGRG